MIEGVGTTALKNGIQYIAIGFQFLLIIYLWKNFNARRTNNAMIIMASIYLILSDSMFTTYKSVYDIRNFAGHIFQLSGYSLFDKGAVSFVHTEKQ